MKESSYANQHYVLDAHNTEAAMNDAYANYMWPYQHEYATYGQAGEFRYNKQISQK